jgi:hypothetical protein
VIDADAHVIETVQTWSSMDDKDVRYTPKVTTQTFGEESKSNEGPTVKDPLPDSLAASDGPTRASDGRA